MAESKKVIICTDGACQPNPGPGGYGVVLVWDRHRKELSGGFRKTTNNRMELLAAIVGLQALKCSCEVTLCTDSRYLVDGIEQGWARRWQQNGWITKDRTPVRNVDLWEKLLELCSQHQVTFQWVRGHSGHPDNECCDALANAALLTDDLPADDGYENEPDLLFGDFDGNSAHA